MTPNGGISIVGTGLTPFGRFLDRTLSDLAAQAVEEALEDAGLGKGEVEMAFVAKATAALTAGQVAVVGQVVLAHMGIGGIPVYNIDNACAGSSSALNLATMAIDAGAVRTVLVVGVEKLFHPNRAVTYRALNGNADATWAAGTGVDLDSESVFIKKVYPARLAAYRERWGLDATTLAKIAVKNRSHAASNELAQYRKPLTVDDVLAARMVAEPLTALMCAPIGDGASAVVVSSGERARGPRAPVWILGSAVGMCAPHHKAMATVGRVAAQAYSQARLLATDIDVAEVHDATSFSELLAYEDLGFCAPGEGATSTESGDFTLGGRLPVNPSGGLESRGHPVAATGVAQIVELVRQLRGEAGDRQVAGARYALAETAGGYAGGDSAAVAVHILGREPAQP